MRYNGSRLIFWSKGSCLCFICWIFCFYGELRVLDWWNQHRRVHMLVDCGICRNLTFHIWLISMISQKTQGWTNDKVYTLCAERRHNEKQLAEWRRPPNLIFTTQIPYSLSANTHLIWILSLLFSAYLTHLHPKSIQTYFAGIRRMKCSTLHHPLFIELMQ